MKKTYLGLDFGGTKLMIGEVDELGNVLCGKRYPTVCDNQEEAAQIILEALKNYCETVGFKGELQAAGIGIVGISDNRKGQWIAMAHEILEPPVLLSDLLQEILHVPCFIDNDVRSAVTAELLLGLVRVPKILSI